MRCVFLAPLKPPDDPAPSGDRLIARAFLALLGRLGFDAALASRLRTRCRTPEALAPLRREAAAEVERIVAEAAGAALVFTYHNYYRAPDLIGPEVARRLGVPYVIAESSRAPKRAAGEWREAHALAEAASDAARLIIAPTAHDLDQLERQKPPSQRLLHLKPFLDLGSAPPQRSVSGGPVRLATVAMMRAGNKAESYFALAAILERLPPLDWTLDIAGDGTERAAVEARFDSLGRRVRVHGALDPAGVETLLAASDLFVWPAVEEPIGMVFLEAAAHGVPSLAYRYRGVPDVVGDGRSGLLFAPEDADGFGSALAELIRDAARREALGRSARRTFEEEHTLDAAAAAVAAAFKDAGLPLPR